MKRVLAQKTFFTANSQVEGSIQDYVPIYTVPSPTIPDIYSDRIFADVVIYIHPTLSSDEEDISLNFNIRIVKNEEVINPTFPKMMVNVDGVPTEVVNEDQWNIDYGKNILIHRPSRNRSAFPIKLSGITMESGDMVVVQSLTSGVTVQVFGEELQYDSDCYFRMHRDMMTLQRQQDLAESNETQAILVAWRQQDLTEADQSQVKLEQIREAINAHQTQYTCVCG